MFGPDICGPITKDDTGNNMYEDKLCAMLMCPVTGLEMNGKFHFFVVPKEDAYNPNIRHLQLQPATATTTATTTGTATCNRNLLSVYKTHTHMRNNKLARNDKNARYVAHVVIKTWWNHRGEASETMQPSGTTHDQFSV